MNKREIEVTLEKYKKEVIESILSEIMVQMSNMTSIEEVKEYINWRIRMNARRQ